MGPPTTSHSIDYVIGGEARLGQGWKMRDPRHLPPVAAISLQPLSACRCRYGRAHHGAYASIASSSGISISNSRASREPHRPDIVAPAAARCGADGYLRGLNAGVTPPVIPAS